MSGDFVNATDRDLVQALRRKDEEIAHLRRENGLLKRQLLELESRSAQIAHIRSTEDVSGDDNASQTAGMSQTRPSGGSLGTTSVRTHRDVQVKLEGHDGGSSSSSVMRPPKTGSKDSPLEVINSESENERQGTSAPVRRISQRLRKRARAMNTNSETEDEAFEEQRKRRIVRRDSSEELKPPVITAPAGGRESDVVAELPNEMQPKYDNVTEEDRETVRRCLNPKAMIKQEMLLSDGTVLSRLKLVGLEPYPVPLPSEVRDIPVSRVLTSKLFGGNTQQTFPQITKEKLAAHGYKHFMYLNLDYNPHAPQMPGYPGLFFDTGEGPSGENPRI